MRIIRGRADARWLPSRYSLAMFRLYAFFRASTAPAEEHPEIVLSVETHQAAAEAFLTAAAGFVMSYVYIADVLTEVLPVLVAILLALPVTSIAIQIPLYVFGLTLTPLLRLVLRKQQSLSITSALYFLLFAASSVVMLGRSMPARVVAWAFFVACALELVSKVIAFALRERMARMEEHFGGVASGVSF